MGVEQGTAKTKSTLTAKTSQIMGHQVCSQVSSKWNIQKHRQHYVMWLREQAQAIETTFGKIYCSVTHFFVMPCDIKEAGGCRPIT